VYIHECKRYIGTFSELLRIVKLLKKVWRFVRVFIMMHHFAISKKSLLIGAFGVKNLYLSW